MNKEMIEINKRLDRLEECLETIVGFIYDHSLYVQESNNSIEHATKLTEQMYENRTGLDVITGEKIDE